MDNIIKSPIVSFDVYDVKTSKGTPAKVKGRAFNALTYRKKGSVKINIKGQTMVSSTDFITFTPQKTNYFTEVVEDTHIIAIHFNCLDKNSFQSPFVFKNNNQQVQQLFDLIYEKYSVEDKNNYECYSLLYKLLAEIDKHFRIKRENKIISAIVEAKSKIEKNFQDNNFNIDLLVSQLPISASYLRKEFKKAYSVTPIDYLKYMRHQKAISLLASEYYSIEELAKKCGYCSASYFIQAFRKSTGYSPTEYKKKYLN